MVSLKEALKESWAAEAESRRRAEQVVLAAAVLSLRKPADQDETASGNVVLLRPPTG